MIFRRQAHSSRSKLHLKVFSLHRTLLPWYSTDIHFCNIREFLCPKIRNTDWTITTSQGQDLERWFRENGKGNACFTVFKGEFDLSRMDFNNRTTVSFTDRNTALMFKLALGGR